MENFEIITDSSANLQKALLDIYHIHILTLRFSRDKKEYRSYEEGVDRALDEVYESLRKKEKIETFCVEEKEAYDKIYELTKQGKDVLYIGMSSAMSNTYENVEKAVHRVQKEFPDRKLKSVDSLGVALGEGLLVRCAVELRQEGKSLEEVYQWLLSHRLHMCHEIAVDTTEFLQPFASNESGISRQKNMNSKVVLTLDDEGKAAVEQRIRGRKQSLDYLVDQLKKYAMDLNRYPVYISHGDCREEAEYVAARIKEETEAKEVLIRVLDPALAAHCGPGTIGLFYYGAHRRVRVFKNDKVHIFLVNSCAGNRQFVSCLRQELARTEGLEYYIFTLKKAGQEREVIQRARELFGSDKLRFYCCGGAGTMRNILNGFESLEKEEIAFYPKGMYNDFVKSFGKEGKRFEDLYELIHGEVVSVDYIRTNHGVALNSISNGLDTTLLKQLNKYRLIYLFGKRIPYLLAFLETICKSRWIPLEIRIDGVVYSGKCREIIFCNGISIGGGFKVAGSTSVTDGSGNFCVVMDRAVMPFLKHMNRLKRGKLKENTRGFHLGTFRKAKIRRTDGKPLMLNQDGCLIGDFDQWEIEIRQQGLHLVVPKGVRV